jgi:hypothetical protein
VKSPPIDTQFLLAQKDRIIASRDVADALISASGGNGVWMQNPASGVRVLMNHRDTLSRLLAEGWDYVLPETILQVADEAASVETVEDTPVTVDATPRPAQSVTQHVRRQAALNAANAHVIRPPTARRKRG